MASRIDLIYGPPGSGKSTALLALITHVYQQTGKLARVWVGDGSTATYRDSGLVDAGIIKLAEYTTRDFPLTTTEQICDGYWPADEEDPTSPLKPLSAAERSETGIWIIEGVSVMGAYLLGSRKGGLAYQSAQGIKIGQDSPIRIEDAEIDPKTGRYQPNTGTGRRFGGNPLSHFGVGQSRLRDLIERSKALPGWVWWTAHEVVSEDKTTNEKIIGPEMSGRAFSLTLPRTFGNTLHATTALKSAGRERAKDGYTGVDVRQAQLEYRIYTRDHYDPDGVTSTRYIAMVRTPLPELVKDYYTGAPGEAIVQLYDDLEKAKAENLRRVQAGRAAAAGKGESAA